MTTEEPTQLDRIEAKLDRVLETQTEPEICNNRYAVRSGGSLIDYVDCPQPRPCLIHDRPRGYTLGDQFNDLIERHASLQTNDAEFYRQVSIITGIPQPSTAQQADHLMTRYRDGLMTEEEARERITKMTGISYPAATSENN